MVHFYAGVLAALAGSKVRLLPLPSYAPWTNPIEKVWRKLKQELLRQHDFADDWKGLRCAVADWLRRAREDAGDCAATRGCAASENARLSTGNLSKTIRAGLTKQSTRIRYCTNSINQEEFCCTCFSPHYNGVSTV